MTHHSHSPECCRRCGSRDLEYDRIRHQSVRIVSCLDCGAVFAIRRPTVKIDPPQLRVGRDRYDSATDSEYEEEAGHFDE